MQIANIHWREANKKPRQNCIKIKNCIKTKSPTRNFRELTKCR